MILPRNELWLCYYSTPGGCQSSLKELEKEFFAGLVMKELIHLESTIGVDAKTRTSSRRRSSLLRASGRRASDSGFGLVVRRLSLDQFDVLELA